MKRVLALVLTFALVLSGCAPSAKEASNTSEPAVESETVSEKTNNTAYESSEPVENKAEIEETESVTTESSEDPEDLSFTGLNDPKLLQYVEDSVYSDLVAEFASEDYIIEKNNW